MQKTAYEMRISDWSSDVCSSDLLADDPFLEWRSDVQPRGRCRNNPSANRRVPRRHPPPTPPFQGGEAQHIIPLPAKGGARGGYRRRRRSEESSEGKGGVSTGRYRLSTCHYKNKPKKET